MQPLCECLKDSGAFWRSHRRPGDGCAGSGCGVFLFFLYDIPSGTPALGMLVVGVYG